MKIKRLAVTLKAAVFFLAAVWSVAANSLTNKEIRNLTVTQISQMDITFFQTISSTQFSLLTDRLVWLDDELDDETKARVFFSLPQSLFEKQFTTRFDGKYGKHHKKFDKELKKEVEKYYKAYLPKGIKAKVKVKHGLITVKFKLDKKKFKHGKHITKDFLAWIEFQGMKKGDVDYFLELMPATVQDSVTDIDILIKGDTITLNSATLDVNTIRNLTVDELSLLVDEQFVLFVESLTTFSGDLTDEEKARIFMALPQDQFQTKYVDDEYGKDCKKFGKTEERKLEKSYKDLLPKYIKPKIKVHKKGECRIKVTFKLDDKKAYKYMTRDFIYWIDLDGMKKQQIFDLFALMPKDIGAEWTNADIIRLTQTEVDLTSLTVSDIETLSIDYLTSLTGFQLMTLKDRLSVIGSSLDDETRLRILFNISHRRLEAEFVSSVDTKRGKDDKRIESEVKNFYRSLLPKGIDAKVKVKHGKISVKFEITDKKWFENMTTGFISWIDFDGLENDEVFALFDLMPATVVKKGGWTKTEISNLIVGDVDVTSIDAAEIAELPVSFVSSLQGVELAQFIDNLGKVGGDFGGDIKTQIFMALKQQTLLGMFLNDFETKHGHRKFKKLKKRDLEKAVNDFYKPYLPRGFKVSFKIVEDDQLVIRFKVPKKVYQYMTPSFVSWIFFEGVKKEDVLTLFETMPQEVQDEWVETDVDFLLENEDSIIIVDESSTPTIIVGDEILTPSTITDGGTIMVDIDFVTLDAAAVSELENDVIVNLTVGDVTKISLEALAGFTAEQMCKLNKDVLVDRGLEILMSIASEEVEKLVTDDSQETLECLSSNHNMLAWVILNHREAIKADNLDKHLKVVGWTIEDGKFNLTKGAVNKLSINIFESLTDIQIVKFVPTFFSHLTAKQVGSLSLSVVGALTPFQVAKLNAKAIAGLSIADLSYEAVNGLTSEMVSVEILNSLTTINIAGLAPDVILNHVDIKILNKLEVDKLSVGEIIKIVSNLDVEKVSPAEVKEVFSSRSEEVNINLTTGKLELKIGEAILPKFVKKRELPVAIVLPELPDLNVSLTVGKTTQTILMDLNEAGCSFSTLEQLDSGILATSSNASFIHVTEQLDDSTSQGCSQNEVGHYEIVTNDNLKVTLMPVAEPELLFEIEVVSGVEVKENAQVIIEISDRTAPAVVGIFSETIVETDREPSIIFSGTVGVDEIAKVVYVGGMMQTMYPVTVASFEKVKMAPIPGRDREICLDYVFRTDGKVEYEIDGSRWVAIPEFDVIVDSGDTHDKPVLAGDSSGNIKLTSEVGESQLFHIELFGSVTGANGEITCE